MFVTHDNEEALSIADRIAVMIRGEIRQAGTPFDVYVNPGDGEVAELVGEINVLPAEIRDHRAASVVGDVETDGMPDGPCRVLVRPESVGILPDEHGQAVVVDVAYFGHDQLIRCEADGAAQVIVRIMGPGPSVAPGDRVRLTLAGPAVALPS